MRRTPFTVLLALAALVLATTAPALAQTDDEYIAEAEGTGYSVAIDGEEPFAGGITWAEVNSDPFAHAFGVGSTLDEESESEAAAESDGDHEADSGEGSLDQIPLVGDMIQVSSSAEAGIADGLPSAAAEADGLFLELSGGPLAEILAEVFVNLEPVTEGLDEGIDELEDQVLTPVTEELANACHEIVAELYEGADPLLDVLGQIGDEAPEDFDELIALLDEFEEVLEEEACALLLVIVTNPPQVGDVLDALLEALEALTLLTVELASSESEAEAMAAQVVAAAEAAGLDIALPSLATLGDVLDIVLQALVDDFVDEVEETFLEPIGETAEAILPEDLMQFLSPILGLELLDDDTPILHITAGDTAATATFDRSTGDVTATGTAVPLRVSIAESIAGLLGQDATLIEVGEGEEAWIFEGTPLESRLAAGAVTESDAERDGLEGVEVVAEAFALDLIHYAGTDEEPLLGITSSESYAAAFGEVDEAVDAPPLPITGGGFALLAVALLGAGLLLRGRENQP